MLSLNLDWKHFPICLYLSGCPHSIDEGKEVLGVGMCVRECLVRKEKIWVPPHWTPKLCPSPLPLPICCLMWEVVPLQPWPCCPDEKYKSPLSLCYQKLKFCCLIKLPRGPSHLWILPRWLFTLKSMTQKLDICHPCGVGTPCALLKRGLTS